MVNGKLLLNVIVIVDELFPFPPTFSLCWELMMEMNSIHFLLWNKSHFY